MDNNKSDVEKALEEIFGESFDDTNSNTDSKNEFKTDMDDIFKEVSDKLTEESSLDSKNVSEDVSNVIDDAFINTDNISDQDITSNAENELQSNSTLEEVITNEDTTILNDINNDNEVVNNEINEINSIPFEPKENNIYSDGEDYVKIAKYEDNINSDVSLENNVQLSEEELDQIHESIKNNINNRKKFNEDVVVVDNNNEFLTNRKKDIISNHPVLYMITFVVILAVLTVFAIYTSNKEQITTCTYAVYDKGYKQTDKYIIAHKSNNLTYIQGEYEYVAIDEEYKEQIELIKNDKLPVIINSNGKPGFTHTYNVDELSIKISSYYDMTKINFKEVDKNNDKTTPLSYLNLKSTTTFKKLQANLQKQGYKCKKSN